MTPAKRNTLLVFAAIGVVIFLATLVDLTPCGDIEGFARAKLADVARFKSSKQYETVSMCRKKPWAQWVLTFSLIRNFNKLNIFPKPYRVAQTKHRDIKDISRNLNVLNGIKVTASIYCLLGATYFFAYYSILGSSY